MNQTSFLILAGVFGIWNLMLTIFFIRLVRHYRGLTKEINGENLEKILEAILKEGRVSREDIDKIKEEISFLEKESYFHFQKAGLIKFNPFSDLGGNQSFSLALLNGKNKGLVVTALHGRQTTRLYTKLINGEKDIKLSEEEIRAVKKAAK